MSSEKTYDLHGCERRVLHGDEPGAYLERVNITERSIAEDEFCEALGVPVSELLLCTCHMRWVRGPLVEGWLECSADHPDAVPFWKDAP